MPPKKGQKRTSPAEQPSERQPTDADPEYADHTGEGLQDADDILELGASASQVSSRRSTSSLHSLAAEERAAAQALQVSLETLKKKRELEKRRFELRMKREQEDLDLKYQEEELELCSRMQQSKLKLQVYENEQNIVDNVENFENCNVSHVNKCKAIDDRDNNHVNKEIVSVGEMLSHMSLPNVEIPMFSGDPVQFPRFMSAIENLIETKVTNNSSRLYYLMQHTSGDVKDLIASYLYNPVDGYHEAKSMLQKLYGHPFKVANAYMQKVMQWNVIKGEDRQGLQKFSLFLKTCENTLNEIGYSTKSDSHEFLRGVISKLPFDLRKKWRFRADHIWEDEGRELSFCDIVKFVEREARAATHPIFGDLSPEGQTSSKVASKQIPKRSNFATNASDTKSKLCVVCSLSHRIDECVNFKELPHDEKAKVVKTKGLCFKCLIPGHIVKSCSSKTVCTICKGRHHTLMHKGQQVETNTCTIGSESEMEQNIHKTATHAQATNGFVGLNVSKPRVALPIVAVKVKGRNSDQFVYTYALLDGGSNATFVSDELVQSVRLEGRKTLLSLNTLNHSSQNITSKLFDFDIYNMSGDTLFELKSVFSCPCLPIAKEDLPNQKETGKWEHLRGIDIAEVPKDALQKVSLLIGNDHFQAMEPLEIIRGANGGPYAVRTPLGWVLNGQRGKEPRNLPSSATSYFTDLQEQFENMYNAEFSDILASEKLEMSEDDKKALDVMQRSAVLKNGHYEIELPLKGSKVILQDNISQVKHRLALLEKRLRKDRMLHEKYVAFMEDCINKGYAEKVSEADNASTDGKVWYIPHHPVTHPQKPGKVRVVFDCSAKYDGICLNDILLQGPDLTNPLIGVLTRFRQGYVALTADIEAMFYQVHVNPKHRDLLRFIWWPKGDFDNPPEIYRMKVHLFGATSSPSCCNFALRRVAEDNKDEFPDEVLGAVKSSFYVDDCLLSTDDPATAGNLAKDLQSLLKKGGFHLTKWRSNEDDLLLEIAGDSFESVKKLDLEKPQCERVLGLQWNTKTDTFEFQVNIKERPLTRRGILSVVSSIYDPLGFISPVILPAKLLLQDLCQMKLGWDDQIPDEKISIWKGWLESLPLLSDYSVNRSMKPPRYGPVKSAQIHHFSDASEKAYGAVSYLRLVNNEDKIHCSLLMSKSKVAPLKRTTIPRLELAGAVVSTRLDTILKKELHIELEPSMFWTDSTAVLKYINNTSSRFQTFVANRISKIRNASNPGQWRYVPTQLNPADDLSRIKKGNGEDTLWSLGPEFLWQTEENWPQQPSDVASIPKDDPEVKRTAFAISTEECYSLSDVFERVSSWHRLKKSVAWMLRFMKILKTRAKDRHPTQHVEIKEVKALSRSEVKRAEISILKVVQKQHFLTEYKLLQNASDKEEQALVPLSSRLVKLDPVFQDGLLKVGGRLRLAAIPEGMKHQVILPKESHVTSLIIDHHHVRNGHAGREHVLAELRKQYWILKGTAAVKGRLHRCFDCKMRQGKPEIQKMADLPRNRMVIDRPPFSFVGVDCFGPFAVKRGRSMEKRYGCIFTCLVIRAVHIEVLHSLDTSSFISGLRRFIARRGCPNEIRSDNGTNFVGAERELKEGINNWNQHQIHEYLLQENIKWIFNPPLGSHHGGAWERCIRTVRKTVTAILKNQTLNDENLSTFMCEAERIINGRPLTRVSEDPRDLSALTPNHLLLLRECRNLPPGIFDKQDQYCRRRWRQIQYMATQFWKRWVSEYLLSLQERQKWFQPRRNLIVGDLVLVSDVNNERGHWVKGIVEEVFPDSVGAVRQVQLRTANGSLRRDVRKLCLLECATDL